MKTRIYAAPAVKGLTINFKIFLFSAENPRCNVLYKRRSHWKG